MDITEDILVEDWQGLESETERLLIVYGYPTLVDKPAAVRNGFEGGGLKPEGHVAAGGTTP